ncbi:hypothetical protein P152DRAFT_457972 [Eremomyces bilateralis CBS 781.70]|uniref:Uncharacterized protein n=1 Tax=Eremomyces bilateralis CBS 781.70 TaxID=1392243 RepID=A0A6G1G4A3_9PEZI|nr:uncharacterized protein P152DRAFT_457972 [Eremomyces bilateralis CBS 781.70]KAF1812771.1 hypothetical protein P152DRAFT_457972 [Eremomyces bilateralis CBS 781.70]
MEEVPADESEAVGGSLSKLAEKGIDQNCHHRVLLIVEPIDPRIRGKRQTGSPSLLTALAISSSYFFSAIVAAVCVGEPRAALSVVDWSEGAWKTPVRSDFEEQHDREDLI